LADPQATSNPEEPLSAEASAEKIPADKTWGTGGGPISSAGSFAYAGIHQATPLPVLSLVALAGTDTWKSGDGDSFEGVQDAPADIGLGAGRLRQLSRSGLCGAIVAAARASDLPVTFFANLIWQESSFDFRTISPAGALGIAQFIPETATERGLMNPFEPIHALFVAGKLLRKLNDDFGNLGLAAAAYNAGPQRVSSWLAERRTLPGETRAYVMRITGRPAIQWMTGELRHDPAAALMPAMAPCQEVKEEVLAQARIVRIATLMSDLAAATAPPPPPQDVASVSSVTAKPAPQPRAAHGVPAGGVRQIAGTRNDTRAWHELKARNAPPLAPKLTAKPVKSATQTKPAKASPRPAPADQRRIAAR